MPKLSPLVIERRKSIAYQRLRILRKYLPQAPSRLRAPNGFSLFIQETTKGIKRGEAYAAIQRLTVPVAEKWKQLTQEQRDEFNRKGREMHPSTQQDMIRFQSELSITSVAAYELAKETAQRANVDAGIEIDKISNHLSRYKFFKKHHGLSRISTAFCLFARDVSRNSNVVRQVFKGFEPQKDSELKVLSARMWSLMSDLDKAPWTQNLERKTEEYREKREELDLKVEDEKMRLRMELDDAAPWDALSRPKYMRRSKYEMTKEMTWWQIRKVSELDRIPSEKRVFSLRFPKDASTEGTFSTSDCEVTDK